MHLRHPHQPVVFEEFFDLGLEESASPFLTPSSRRWGHNLALRSSICAAVLLSVAFILSHFPTLVPLSNVFLAGVFFFAGIPSLIEAIEQMMQFEINIDILMTLAAFSSVLIGSGMEGGLLLVLFALSGAMEESVTAKAKGTIRTLHKLSPTKGVVVEADGNIVERSVHDITVGSKILVKAGEVVPLDGIVIEGNSSVNLVHLTGEATPVPKEIGDEVPAGTQNQEGVLVLKVLRTSSQSALARIISLITQAQEARPRLQRWFDRLSKAYAISIICLAVVFAALLPSLLSIPVLGVEGSIYRALAFLIAASPCALIIAIPIAYLSAISACARRGIVLKGGITLDALAKCGAIAFDKTGTLTTGELACLSMEAVNKTEQGYTMPQALAIAASLEKNVTHPIARAIVARAQERRVGFVPLMQFRSIAGFGVQAQVMKDGKSIDVFLGRAEHFLPQCSESQRAAILSVQQKTQEAGELMTMLKIGDQIFSFRFRDALRPQIKETVASLKKRQRWRLLMLTGDHEANARKVAGEVGIEEWYAGLTPEDKLNYVSTLAEKEGLAMIGDGINDAPALARATVGICMGKVGSAAAVEAADVVLLHDDLELLDWLMSKARMTQQIVRQNLGIAVTAIAIAAIPALAGIVPLWLAVILHEGGTVVVGLNALRLLQGGKK